MAKLAENSYGKSKVRVMKVTRGEDHHDLSEWNVGVYLEGDFNQCFTTGDNGRILPTDTMKNTVYYLARSSKADSIEAFGVELADFLLSRNPQVSSVKVEIEEKRWNRVNGHPTTFQLAGPELQSTKVSGSRDKEFVIRSGVKGLVILKSAHSAFAGYIKDSLTTLPETHDRIFCTEAAIEWTYNESSLAFNEVRARIVSVLLDTFAEHDSQSVQQTLFAMGKAVLESAPEVYDIEAEMPNRHCNLVNLSPFGLDNPNVIFVPTDEPHGTIKARIVR